jgi:hypothetical protein
MYNDVIRIHEVLSVMATVYLVMQRYEMNRDLAPSVSNRNRQKLENFVILAI